MAQFITLPPDWLQKQIEETRREVALWPPPDRNSKTPREPISTAALGSRNGYSE